ncbi:Armadillo/beta-catenin/plakoglobin [Kickxella alabastrina]|uniref:Armadillo/beta-catenin/plakoglobin n=1 Tax=Kickxella alabastrina TaxID=61397 RepID=UPI0022204697|nr:Armadillo/beta-catenin/plakoglobin [Kickxella alabastrina]KAI7827310.1 Armadillo/beta-catenin/plakoglobin [Kickxella alabastrina]
MTTTSSNIFISTHPITQQKISSLRNAKNSARTVRELISSITSLMLYDVTKDLQLQATTEATSPVGSYTEQEITTKVALIPILRSGLAMLGAASDLLHDAEVRHLGLFREETTLQPVEYYNKLPRVCSVDECVVLDPMIATGGTAGAAIEILLSWGVPKIKFLAICASREGVEALAEKYPQVSFYIGVVDDVLDKRGFVSPGIGDCGDRLNSTA